MTEAVIHPDEVLLERIQIENPGLQVEDAFVVPAWFTQQKTWLEQPMSSDNALYNYPLLLRIRGPLNVAALQCSLQEIVRRQGALRSVFRVVDEELVQIVVAPAKLSFPVTDLSGLPEIEREGKTREAALAEARRAFDLANGPVLRARLIRLGDDDHVLQLTTHHLVYDDWSSGILMRDLPGFYENFAAGTEPPAQHTAYQYGDFVRWQQKRLQGASLETELDYWRKQFAGSTGFQHLRPDFARPPKPTGRGSVEKATLPGELSELLKQLSRRESVSLFMVLLAGFQYLLHQESGRQDIGIASCVANRPLLEVEGLIGRFGNRMLLRMSLPGNATFRDLLKRVRDAALDVYSHQEIPFGKVLEEIGGATPGGNPPYQVMFILQNAPKEHRQVPGLTFNWLPLHTGTAKQDLIVWLKAEAEIEITLEYSTDLFTATTMKRVLQIYQTTLERMARDAHAPADAKDGSRPLSETQTERPDNTDFKTRLLELWEKAFGIHPIDTNQNFFELGGDSLLAAKLFTRIEEVFGTRLPLSTLVEAPTIEQLAGILSGHIVRPANSSLVTVQPRGTRPRLFCVHDHEGQPLFCRNLSLNLGADQPVFGFRSQGIGSGETPYFAVEDMAAHYLREARSLQPHGPYYLSGYCFGGIVAYEMANLLADQGEKVALLAMFNTPLPASLEGWPLNQLYLRNRVRHELKTLRALPASEKFAIIAEKAAKLRMLALGSLKTRLLRPQTQRSLSISDINIAAAKAYRPQPYGGRITLFLTEEMPTFYSIHPKDGWMALAAAGVEVHSVAGDNTSLFTTLYVRSVAEKLRACLERAQAC
jgi:thioesterase domain-containing protein/acyl carrier protein